MDTPDEVHRAWRNVMEPWMAQVRDRASRQSPQRRPTGTDRARDELIAATLDEMAARAAARAGRPLSEWAPEVSMDEIRARHGL